jgi:hypothetical protein
LVLGVFTAIFLGGGLITLSLALKLGRSPSGLFAASMAELDRDRAALREAEVEPERELH